MFDNHPILLSALTGYISGVLLSVPVGPVNLTIINGGARTMMSEGPQRGFIHAAMISMGAVAMEVIYCTLAFSGFATFFERGLVKAVMELFSFVFMLFLGLKFLLAKNVTSPTHLTNTTDRIEERIEQRLRPTSAFATGFVRVMANPGVFLFWIILAAKFISREWVEPDRAGVLACVCGVAAGLSSWFLGLSYAVSYGRKKFGEETLLRMEHISGVVLLGIAFIHGGYIIWQLAGHKI